MASFAETVDRITAGELRRRGSLKWTRGGPDTLGAFVAEMDVGTAPAVAAALRAVMDRAEHGWVYTRPGHRGSTSPRPGRSWPR